MIEIEEFRDIPGYEGLYEVSNLGRVRRDGKILKLTKNAKGYFYLNLCKNGIVRKFLVHRLVALAFLPNPQNLPMINLKDEDKTNNAVSNLEWCTVQYNNSYSQSKPVLQFDKSGNFINEYPSVIEASRITRINRHDISQCCRGVYHHKTAGGYLWKYKN